LVTPKESNDSDSVPNLSTQAAAAATASKKISARSSTKQQHSRKNNNAPTLNTSSSAKEFAAAAAAEEEIQVEPMKQDFFFYANDHFDAVRAQCEEECKHSSKSLAGNKENELYRLTTLMNARLIQDWESGPASLREQYMKMEDGDRQRFMSEEEVASRHCATLTARKRSPKQQNGSGKAGGGNARKGSTSDSVDGMVTESKRAKV